MLLFKLFPFPIPPDKGGWNCFFWKYSKAISRNNVRLSGMHDGTFLQLLRGNAIRFLFQLKTFEICGRFAVRDSWRDLHPVGNNSFGVIQIEEDRVKSKHTSRFRR